MDRDEAIQAVQNIGYSYFYDFLDEMSVEEILAQIQADIQGTSGQGLAHWEKLHGAFQIVLTNCSEDELDDISLTFGYVPGEAGESRLFLGRVCGAIAEAMEKRVQME